jgi:hypothetical protein
VRAAWWLWKDFDDAHDVNRVKVYLSNSAPHGSRKSYPYTTFRKRG